MVDVNIKDGVAVFEVLGLHNLWALRSRLEVPLAHIRGVRADPTATLSWKACACPARMCRASSWQGRTTTEAGAVA
jgi:hypothetical protein